MDDLSDIPESSRRMHELPKYPNLKFLRKNDDEQFRKCVRAYLASIAFVDYQVGRVIDALDQGPYAEDTNIILFSDHGYHIGEKDRVSKHSLWEESTRVPLIVVRPDRRLLVSKKAVKACSKPVGLIDLYPTMLEMCDLPPNEKNEGMSLIPLFATRRKNGDLPSLRPMLGKPFTSLGTIQVPSVGGWCGGILQSPDRPQRMEQYRRQ